MTALGEAPPRRGQVWLVALGAGRSGEPAKHRPAVVISLDQLVDDPDDPREMLVVVPLSASSRVAQTRPPVPAAGGLDRDSVALCPAVRAVARGRLVKHLGDLPEPLVEQIARTVARLIVTPSWAP